MQTTFERMSSATEELNRKKRELSKLGEEVKIDINGNEKAGFLPVMETILNTFGFSILVEVIEDQIVTRLKYTTEGSTSFETITSVDRDKGHLIFDRIFNHLNRQRDVV